MMLRSPLALKFSTLATQALRLPRTLRRGILVTALSLSGCAQLPFQSHLLHTSVINDQENPPDTSGMHSMQMADGGEFHGQMQAGIIHGQGKIHWPNNTHYEGEFQQGQFHGQGLMLHSCGYYEGEFQQGQYHGQGQLSCDEYFYEGEFEAGQPEGQGSLIRYQVGTFTGQFHKGLPHGQVKAVFFKHSAYGGGYYLGNFTQGVIQGQGERLYPNGRAYRGHFNEGLPDGPGQIEWPNNDWFKGTFSLGIPAGQGLCSLNGQQGLCDFKQGILINFARQGHNPQQRPPASHPNNGQSTIIAF